MYGSWVRVPAGSLEKPVDNYRPVFFCTAIHACPTDRKFRDQIPQLLIMANFKKIDDQGFVVPSKPLNEKEEKALSDFLKNINTDSKVRAKYFSKAPKKDATR